MYKELSQYLLKVGRRCIRPISLSAEKDYQAILRLPVPDAKALIIGDFNTRSKLGPRLDIGCKQKAEKEHEEDKNKDLSLEKVTAKIRESLGHSAGRYIAYLLGVAEGFTQFISDIVKGLGSFNLEVMLVETMDRVSYSSKQLLSSFKLQGVFRSEEEPIYSEKYLSFNDELRRNVCYNQKCSNLCYR